MEDLRRAALLQVLRGQVDFNAPHGVTEGKRFAAFATVKIDTSQVVSALNTVATLRPGQVLVTVEKMELVLAPDGTNFNVAIADGQGSARTINFFVGSTTWHWNVTARHRGSYPLPLYAWIFVKARDGTETQLSATQDGPAASPSIGVKTNVVYELGLMVDWAAPRWPPIAAVLSVPLALAGYLYRKRKSTEQAKVRPYHTVAQANRESGHREVFHDRSDCPHGRRIEPHNRRPGTARRPKCDECQKIQQSPRS